MVSETALKVGGEFTHPIVMEVGMATRASSPS
jgi:hypothetical protein